MKLLRFHKTFSPFYFETFRRHKDENGNLLSVFLFSNWKLGKIFSGRSWIRQIESFYVRSAGKKSGGRRDCNSRWNFIAFSTPFSWIVSEIFRRKWSCELSPAFSFIQIAHCSILFVTHAHAVAWKIYSTWIIYGPFFPTVLCHFSPRKFIPARIILSPLSFVHDF